MKLVNLPNIITCGNVVCGCFSLYFASQGDLSMASLFIVLAAVFDFFDGMTARALGISGPIGKELDSLADMVSFGVAPAVLAYRSALLLNTAPGHNAFLFGWSMLIAAFSALRLAKFNCDERQSLSFIGLPTPANALFWIGIASLSGSDAVLSFAAQNQTIMGIAWAVLVAVMSVLLICELPMFSLKIKPGHMSWNENKTRYTFLPIAVVLITLSVIYGQATASLAFVILLYILFSLFDFLSARKSL